MSLRIIDASASDFRRIRWVVAGIGAFSAFFGLIVLVGWLAGWSLLVQLRPGLPLMQFNTGLCFVFAGSGLAIWARRRHHPAPPILGGLVAVLGGTTFLEYGINRSLGIDQLFFHGAPFAQEAYAGRMSAISAVCMFFVGLSLVDLSTRKAKQHSWIVGAMASLVISAALNALVGYALGLAEAYQWGQLNRIAPHTAAGLIVLGSGLAIAAWQNGCRPGEKTPRWLPFPLALGVFTSALVLYFALDTKQNGELAQAVRLGASSIQREVTTRFDNRARTLTRMARRWEHTGISSESAWNFEAGLYAHDFPDIQAVEWISPSGEIQWVVPAMDNEAKVGLDAGREERRAAAMAHSQQMHQAVFSGAVTLYRGGLGVIVYTPVQRGDRFEGWIAGIFEVQSFLDRYLPSDVAAFQALRISDGNQTVYARDGATPRPKHAEWLTREKIEFSGIAWDLEVWPTAALTHRSISALPLTVLILGILNGLLIGGICFFAQRHSRISRARAATAADLQKALDEVKTLEGLLPICSCCKRVRDDTGYWNQIDTYLHNHLDAKLSHGYCPECAAKAFTEFGLAVPDRIQAELAARNYE